MSDSLSNQLLTMETFTEESDELNINMQDLNFKENSYLRQTIEQILTRGIPFLLDGNLYSPKLDDVETDEIFVYRDYIYDFDDIKYKIEVHLLTKDIENKISEMKSEYCKLDKKIIDGRKLHGTNNDKDLDDGIIYIRTKTLFLYVYHPYFSEVWKNGASDTITFYFGEKFCRLLFNDEEGFNLELEFNVPKEPIMCDELAIQISRMRERLQCGIFQRYFRLVGLLDKEDNVKLGTTQDKPRIQRKKILIRKHEVIWLVPKGESVEVIICAAYKTELEMFLGRIWCKKLEQFANLNLIPNILSIKFDFNAPLSIKNCFHKSLWKEPLFHLGFLTINLDINLVKYQNGKIRAYSSRRLGNILSCFKPFLDSRIYQTIRSIKRMSEKSLVKDLIEVYNETVT